MFSNLAVDGFFATSFSGQFRILKLGSRFSDIVELVKVA
jgi:hypothetical protein